MRVLVTGGAGFIGSHVIDHLSYSKHSVFVIDNFSTGKRENFQSKNIPLNFKGSDILDEKRLRQDFGITMPDVVIHLAAQAAITTSWSDPLLDMETNIRGTLNIIRMCNEFNVKRLVYASTSAVYRDGTGSALYGIRENDELNPSSPYGISKLAGELYVRNLFADHVVLRLGNVYGPRQVPIGENQVIPLMIRHLMHDNPFAIHGSGKQQRDFVYVTDVAKAFVMAMTGPAGVYNIASGYCKTINEIATVVAMAMGQVGYEWRHDSREDPRKKVLMDVSLSREFLKWSASMEIPRGIAETIEWWKQREHQR